MSITREQIADLNTGDVVEIRGHPAFKGAATTGPLWKGHSGNLYVGDGHIVRYSDGQPNMTYSDRMFLILISRAKPPLYANHPRTDPWAGDVVQDGHGDVWLLDQWQEWHTTHSTCRLSHTQGIEAPRTLLIDGETRQVVSS